MSVLVEGSVDSDVTGRARTHADPPLRTTIPLLLLILILANFNKLKASEH